MFVSSPVLGVPSVSFVREMVTLKSECVCDCFTVLEVVCVYGCVECVCFGCVCKSICLSHMRVLTHACTAVRQVA